MDWAATACVQLFLWYWTPPGLIYIEGCPVGFINDYCDEDWWLVPLCMGSSLLAHAWHHRAYRNACARRDATAGKGVENSRGKNMEDDIMMPFVAWMVVEFLFWMLSIFAWDWARE